MEKFIEWSDELSVGIEEIDNQHKILVDLVNEMHDAVVAHQASEVIQDVLNKLVDYTRIHFAVEESLMRIFHYPDYEKHKQEHEELTQQALDLKRRVEEGQAVSFELLHFLKVWLTKHIMGSDKAYGPFFIAQGVKPNLKKGSWLGRLWEHLH